METSQVSKLLWFFWCLKMIKDLSLLIIDLRFEFHSGKEGTFCFLLFEGMAVIVKPFGFWQAKWESWEHQGGKTPTWIYPSFSWCCFSWKLSHKCMFLFWIQSVERRNDKLDVAIRSHLFLWTDLFIMGCAVITENYSKCLLISHSCMQGLFLEEPGFLLAAGNGSRDRRCVVPHQRNAVLQGSWIRFILLLDTSSNLDPNELEDQFLESVLGYFFLMFSNLLIISFISYGGGGGDCHWAM